MWLLRFRKCMSRASVYHALYIQAHQDTQAHMPRAKQFDHKRRAILHVQLQNDLLAKQ